MPPLSHAGGGWYVQTARTHPGMKGRRRAEECETNKDTVSIMCRMVSTYVDSGDAAGGRPEPALTGPRNEGETVREERLIEGRTLPPLIAARTLSVSLSVVDLDSPA